MKKSPTLFRNKSTSGSESLWLVLQLFRLPRATGNAATIGVLAYANKEDERKHKEKDSRIWKSGWEISPGGLVDECCLWLLLLP